MPNELINNALKVTVSDPWEFYDDNFQSNVFEATILDIREDCLFFQSLDAKKLRKGGQLKDYCKFIAFPRDPSINMIVDLLSVIPCNAYALDSTIGVIDEAELFVSKWRGGAAFIASVCLFSCDIKCP